MKVTNGINTVETTEFLKNIWLRDGYRVVEESEEVEAQKVSSKEPEETKEVLTYQELKTMAKEKGINTHGMKKEEIIESLGM